MAECGFYENAGGGKGTDCGGRLRGENLSVAVQAERPRLAAYIDAIRQSLAAALEIVPPAVGVSAGTNEGLGYVGEGKGITVSAYVLLKGV